MPVLKNPKHEAVAQAFIADKQRNGPRAYRVVYPKSSKHAAETAFGRLLKIAEFARRIAALEKMAADVAVKLGVMSAQEVLLELSHLGRSNMQDFAHISVSDNIVGDVQKLQREHAAAIQEITVETFMDGVGDDAREVKRVKFKLHDKRGALVDLGRHHKLFTEKLEIDDKRGLAEKLTAARRRVATVGSGAKKKPRR
jgi:phage terminase small subunit